MDPGHYEIHMWTYGLEFESPYHLLDYYIQLLAKVVGRSGLVCMIYAFIFIFAFFPQFLFYLFMFFVLVFVD
ncbi:hypothetical protein AQUCO_00201014v1 [Aquilegia coerulea]|uniref:Uncharacterized protein n=1 Tax=Aquilegia coerulea TaxID=218851 RepID=A0A2G5F610_AQUCA|nr:hypothetical protein AQUCO_00201014v1 [Aquilegia coerulea]